MRDMTIAEINATIADAGKQLDQARRSLGDGDKATAIYRLEHAAAAIRGAIRDVKQQHRGDAQR